MRSATPLPTRRSALFVGLLVLAFAGLAWSGARQLGATVDEIGHITSGYVQWRFGDQRLNAEGGMLATKIISAPLLSMDLTFPGRNDVAWHGADTRKIAYRFFFETGNDFDAMLRRARSAALILALLLPWLIWRWTLTLFGGEAAWVALALAAFSPTLLAHSGLATVDIVFTVCLLAALSAWWQLLHRLSVGTSLAVAAATGAALLTKMSGTLLLPLVTILIVVRGLHFVPLVVRFRGRVIWLRRSTVRWRALAGVAVAALLVTWGLIWAGYGFRYAAIPAGVQDDSFEVTWAALLGKEPLRPQWQSPSEPTVAPWRKPVAPADPVVQDVAWAARHHLLPEAYLWGFLRTYESTRGHEAFLNGKVSVDGWWWFFPEAFLLKSTPAELLAFGLGIVATILTLVGARGGSSRRAWRLAYRATPLLLLFAVYWALAISTPFNIGHRHLLPIYPIVFIAGGAGVAWLLRRRTVGGRIVLAVLVGWQVGDALVARPFYLSYFTEGVGGMRRGWHYLVDSSYDWGQGLPQLAHWIAAQRAAGNREPVFLTYFGTDSPVARKLDVTRFGDFQTDFTSRVAPAPVQGGWFAISATHFQRVYLADGRPWTSACERDYIETQGTLSRLASLRALTPVEQAEGGLLARHFEFLQFERLCHFLQDRRPDDLVGGSILLFHLTDQEVQQALYGPLNRSGPG